MTGNNNANSKGPPSEDSDGSLEAFLKAGDDAAADDLLSELINDRVEPLVRSVVRNRLNVSLRASDERKVNEDAGEIVSEVKTLIVAKLADLKSSDGVRGVENLEAYVKTTAGNACNQYLRQKYPERLRLKNQLRYLLSHDPRFSLWKAENGDLVCGFASWELTDPDEIAIENVESLIDELRKGFETRRTAPDRIGIVDLVAAVFEHCQRPLRFADLVSSVYTLRNIKEAIEVSEEETLSGDVLRVQTHLLDRLEQAQFLKRMWEEIGSLPLRHRCTLLLNLRDRDGDGMITLLPVARIATIAEIAAAMEFRAEEFAAIWHELPWEDNRIADYLGLTRQQVINLRQSARATLRRRLNY